MKRADGKAFSIEISFTRPFYFHWIKEFKLWHTNKERYDNKRI
jgi:hypothetical protein